MNRLVVGVGAFFVFCCISDLAVTCYMLGQPPRLEIIEVYEGGEILYQDETILIVDGGGYSARTVWNRECETNQFAAWHTGEWVISSTLITVGLLAAGYLVSTFNSVKLNYGYALILAVMAVIRLYGVASWVMI